MTPTSPPKTSNQDTTDTIDASSRTDESGTNDSIVVEVRPTPNPRDWHAHPERTKNRTAIVPAKPSPSARFRVGNGGSGGAIQRFANRAAQSSPGSSVTLARFGKIAGSLGTLTTQPTVGIGVTSTNHKNNQALTAIGIATVWAQWGHRTLLINADPARCKLTKALKNSQPTLHDLIHALNHGKTLALPQSLTSNLDDLEAISDIGDFSLAQIGETGILQKLDYALRTRYDRIVWSLPPLNQQDWSPILIRPVVDSLVISAKRGRTNLRQVEKLADLMSYTDWPPLQVTWHE